MKADAIYTFEDPRDYLGWLFGQAKLRNRQLSRNSWAKRIGIANSSLLGMLFKKKRVLSTKVASDIKSHLELHPYSARYFDVMVKAHLCRDAEEKKFFVSLLQQLKSANQCDPLTMDQAIVMSDWRAFAILESIDLKEIRDGKTTVHEYVSKCISEKDCSEMLERLCGLGLIAKKGDCYERVKSNMFMIPPDQGYQFARNIQDQFIELSRKALQNEPPHLREFTCHTISSTPEKVQLAKQLIREFVLNLSDCLASDQPTAVYQFNIQLFDLVRSACSPK